MRYFCASVALLAMLATAPAALGTTWVRELSARQLGDQAAAVVRGEVGGVRSYWNEQRTKIFTEILVQTRETYKGAPGASVTILQLGGVVDNVRVTVHGALQWQPGEEVLLFLEPYRDGLYQVAGFSQGKLPIERDPATGEAYVRSLTGAPAGGKDLARRPQRIPLQSFVREALGSVPALERP